jgi:hypothetical protein
VSGTGRLDLLETLRSTGAVREFTDEAVDDDVVRRTSTPPASRRAVATASRGTSSS